MNNGFFSRLDESIRRTGSLLCIGLDPFVKDKSEKAALDAIVNINRSIIEETLEYAACFKPNSAFYEMHGPYGFEALQKTIEIIGGRVPVILDVKRGDIGDTSRAYAEAVFGYFKADACTVSPYMGKDSIDPFLSFGDKGLFVLCKTTNPQAGKIQNIMCSGSGEDVPLYMKIAREAVGWSDSVGLVVAGNDIETLAAIRKEMPGIWFLSPGIGAQGGTVEAALEAGMRDDRSGILINVSRAISQADSPKAAARMFYERIWSARDKTKTKPAGNIKQRDTRKDVIKSIIDEGCFKTGSFTLKSGKLSPFYIDLRRIISSPLLMKRVAACYAEILRTLDYKRIAGIPFAGIPIATAVSLSLGKPMIFPRLEKKDHGSGNVIEGAFEKGEKAVLLDDLITTGKSKFEALDVLTSSGLEVRDLVVLVERGTSGRAELEERGVKLHACFNVSDFLNVSFESGIIDDKELSDIGNFLAQG